MELEIGCAAVQRTMHAEIEIVTTSANTSEDEKLSC